MIWAAREAAVIAATLAELAPEGELHLFLETTRQTIVAHREEATAIFEDLE